MNTGYRRSPSRYFFTPQKTSILNLRSQRHTTVVVMRAFAIATIFCLVIAPSLAAPSMQYASSVASDMMLHCPASLAELSAS